MDKAKEEDNIVGIGLEDLSTDLTTGNPRDLLNKFTKRNEHPIKVAAEEIEEIKLNLELTLGGSFGLGLGPNELGKLLRSSSIAVPPVVAPEINRTNSLPISLPKETKIEWTKELESRWRMDAMRKPWEEQTNFPESKGKQVAAAAAAEAAKDLAFMNSKWKQSGTLPVGLPYRDPSSRGAVLVPVIDSSLKEKANALAAITTEPGAPLRGLTPLLSLGSQASNAAAISKFQGESIQGLSKGTGMESPMTVQLIPEQSQKRSIIATTTTFAEGVSAKVAMGNRLKKPKMIGRSVKEIGMKVMEGMPCVSTKNIPNGKIIDGFLYKYKAGEEVKIMCECHGNSFSPAEFIKHAGGDDVEHPLKHIVIKPSSSFQ